MLMSEPTADSIREAEDRANEAPARKRRRRKLDASSASVAALLILAGAGLWYMHWRTRDAVAFITAADAKAATLGTLLENSKKTLATLSTSMKQTQQVVDGVAGNDSTRLASFKALDRDPFVFEPPQLSQAPQAELDTNRVAREQAREKALAAARTLQLQSIMFGSARRSCLIDGKLYFEKAKLNDFTITRINPDSVIVQTGEFFFELKLRK